MPAVAALAACQADPQPLSMFVPGHDGSMYLPAERLEGHLTLGFEASTFNDCWFAMTEQAARQLGRADAEASARGPHEYRVVIMGNRAPHLDLGGYGHLGAYSCQVRAVRFLSIEPAS